MPRRPALYPRQRWEWATDLPTSRVAWSDLLRLSDATFLTDNQVSLWASPDGVGVEKVWFYPVPRAPHLDSARYDPGRIARDSIHELLGPSVHVWRRGEPVKWDVVESAWLPSMLTRTLRDDDLSLTETVSVLEDVVLIWQRPTEGTKAAQSRQSKDLSLRWSARVERTQTASWRSHGPAHVCLHDDGVANGWVWLGSDISAWDTHAAPGCLSFEASMSPRGVVLILMLGYDQAAVERRLEAMIAQLGRKSPTEVATEFLAKASEVWDWYMAHMVPAFTGGPEWIRRLYYYQMASHRINLYDIPYEPFVFPYTCPWKTSAVWQWSWNTPMNSIAERWLNDPAWAEAGIELIRENGGALNIGASLHRLRKPRHFRDVYEFLPALHKAMEGTLTLPATARQFDWAFILPHTTPLGPHGIYEVFRRTGDELFLKRHLPDMIAYEQKLTSHDPDGDALVDYSGMVDEYDYSLRWRTVVPGYRKGSQSLLKFERPLEMIDINAQLCLLREDLAEVASLFGDKNLERRMRQRHAKTAKAINELLWDEERGCYRDIHSDTHEGTGVYSVAAYSALLAGVASSERAERMVSLLDDPKAFGSPYPVPSVMMDTPDLDPSHITYGGDVLITSGIWITVNGLVRYGYTDKAREIIWKALKMVGKNGPTSAYSYHSITGEPNMPRHTFCSQSAILLDLFVRYVVGFIPRPDDIIELWPFALPTQWKHVEFGPMTWRGDVDVKIVWDNRSGYTITVGKARFTMKELRHTWLGLDLQDNLVELPDPAVAGAPVMV